MKASLLSKLKLKLDKGTGAANGEVASPSVTEIKEEETTPMDVA
jgi:hypothetical protein